MSGRVLPESVDSDHDDDNSIIHDEINVEDFSLPLDNPYAFVKTINEVYRNDFMFQEDKIYACLRHFSGIGFHLSPIDSLFQKGHHNRTSRDPHVIVLSMRMLKTLNSLDIPDGSDFSEYTEFVQEVSKIEQYILSSTSYSNSVVERIKEFRSNDIPSIRSPAPPRDSIPQRLTKDLKLIHDTSFTGLEQINKTLGEKTYVNSVYTFPGISELITTATTKLDKRRFLDPRMLEKALHGPTNIYTRIITEIIEEEERKNPNLKLNWNDYEKELEHVVISSFNSAYSILRSAYSKNPNTKGLKPPPINDLLQKGPEDELCGAFIRLCAAVYSNTITNGRSLVNNVKINKTLLDLKSAQSSLYRVISNKESRKNDYFRYL